MSIPSSPQNIILQTGNGQNFLSWDAVVGATSYSVHRSTDGITFSSYATPSVNSYLDTVVTVGTTYYYQVCSNNGTDSSAFIACYPAGITPCLPGQINLGYLRYMSQLRSDKLTSLYLTTDEWNFNLNQSALELYDILNNHYGDDYFFAPALLISLTGAEYYPIPNGSNYSAAPALYKLNGIDANVSGASTGPNAGWVPLARSNWSDRDRYTSWPGQAGALNNIYQMSYRQMGSNIFLFPANQSMLIRVWYIPILTQMLQDADMMPFSISGWSEYVIVDCAMKAMIKEESLEKWNALQASKDRLLERIEVTAANRDVGQPNTISNFRATMGDPGFSNWGSGFGGGGFGGSGAGY